MTIKKIIQVSLLVLTLAYPDGTGRLINPLKMFCCQKDSDEPISVWQLPRNFSGNVDQDNKWLQENHLETVDDTLREGGEPRIRFSGNSVRIDAIHQDTDQGKLTDIAQEKIPPLEYSDAWVKERIINESSNPGYLSIILQTKELVRKVALLLNGIEEGYIPRKWLATLKPQAPFTVIPLQESSAFATDRLPRFELDPTSFHRYDALIDALDSLTSEQWFSIYLMVKPILNEACLDLGVAETDLDLRLIGALTKVVNTPVITHSLLLVRPTVTYKFVDGKLERLSDFDKQMIRIGPRNTQILQKKASQFIALIEKHQLAN